MRKIVIILLCCTTALLAGYAGYRGYKVWKQSHMISLARGFLAKSDNRNALLCLQQALRSNSRNIEACRLMAELAEASHSPAVLQWRNRVVELNPKSVEDRLALAAAAITLRDVITATNALVGISEDGKKTAGYHNLAGTVAAGINQVSEAQFHFLEQSRLEPTNPVPQLNLAVIRLKETNAQVLAEARASLKQLCANPVLRRQALRELVVDAMRYKQTNEALAMSKELLQQTNSLFRDRLLRLDVLRSTQNPEFNTSLAAFQKEAANDMGKAYELATWQMARTGPADVLPWLSSLPMNLQTNQPVALLIAECRSLSQDWRGLRASLETQSWAELDFVRHAFLARAMRGQDLTSSAKTEWGMASKIANARKENLVMLLRLAAQWNWQGEGEEILWTIVNRYPGEKWATRALTQILMASGQTRPLMMLLGQQLKSRPADLSTKNNLAMTALLLNAQELKPYDLAREVYQKAPTNTAYASTYAFSLHLQDKSAEALKVLETLTPQDLEDPSVAGYYGLVLKATGNGAKAKKYLDLASKTKGLPEEQKLFDKARGGR